MRRMMLLIAFCALGVLTFAPAATAQQNPACSELGFIESVVKQGARLYLDQYPSDPSGLDADGDGIPCEGTQSSGQVYYEDGSVLDIPMPSDYPQVSEEGRVSLSFDTGTDCRTISIVAERGGPPSLTQEEVQGVLEECRSLGYLPSGAQYAPDSGGEEVAELPDTGGPSGLALLGGALLLGSGLVIRRIVR